MIQIEHNRIKKTQLAAGNQLAIYKRGRRDVNYIRDDREQIQQVSTAGLEPGNPGPGWIASPTTGSPNSVGVRWTLTGEFVRECMKINKIRPKFHFFFFDKNRNKNDLPYVFVLF